MRRLVDGRAHWPAQSPVLLCRHHKITTAKKSNTVRSTVSTGTKDEAEPPGDAQLRALEVYPAAFRSRYTLTHSSVVCSLTTKQGTE